MLPAGQRLVQIDLLILALQETSTFMQEPFGQCFCRKKWFVSLDDFGSYVIISAFTFQLHKALTVYFRLISFVERSIFDQRFRIMVLVGICPKVSHCMYCPLEKNSCHFPGIANVYKWILYQLKCLINYASGQSRFCCY